MKRIRHLWLSFKILLGLICFLFLLLIITDNAYADNPGNGCLFTTVNDIANDCYTITLPSGSGAGITFNGIDDEPVWNSLAVPKPNILKDLITAGNPSGSIKIFREANHTLHLFIRVTDNSSSNSDSVLLFIDPLHNHSVTNDDIRYRFRRSTTLSAEKSIGGGALGDWVPATLGSQFQIGGTSSGSPDWTIELRLTAAEFGVSDLPPIIGFGVQAENSDTGDLAMWPANLLQSDPATTWANLKTRYPIQYALVLDQSGSMLSANKWNDAKQAANFLANTMAILADTEYFDDQIGVVPFKWLCSGGSAANTQFEQPLTTVDPPGGSPLFDNYVTVSDPISNNCTPIGEGMKKALQPPDGLDGSTATAAKERERVILLLSDGLHNQPSTTLSATIAEFGYIPCAGTALGSACAEVSNVRVNAVGLGNDGTVPADLLTNIKNRYGSQTQFTPLPRYGITTDAEQLKEIFISSLRDLYGINLITSSPGLTDFTVNANEQRLIVVLSWAIPNNADPFTLERFNGGSWVGQTCSRAGHSDPIGYAFCVVDTPQAGQWRVNPTIPVAPSRLFALVDLSLSAKFAIDRSIHGTGQDIILTADLKQAGQPLTNDSVNHPVKVTVNVEKPQEGFGEFVSTREPKTCEVRQPQLPRLPGSLISQGGATSFQPPFSSVSTIAASAVASTNPDPPMPRFALAQQLFRDCHKTGLLRAEELNLELHDDGMNGDAIANDGLYTLRFTDASYEGSYIFRFNAEGKTLDGDEFTRTELLAEYARVEVDPNTTITGSRTLQQNGRQIIKEYYAIPMDRFGRHLGPGYPEQVQFLQLGSGQWLSTVMEPMHGIYSRLLSYDATQREPVISVIIQDKPIQVGKLPLPWWILWIMILLILIILLLLIWLLRRSITNP